MIDVERNVDPLQTTSPLPAPPRAPAELAPTKGKGGRPTLLTPEVEAAILTRVRVGAFAWVAAVSAGVSPSSFQRWMMTGKREQEEWEALCVQHEEDDAWEPPELGRWGKFYAEVAKARATARMAAETDVRKGNPLAWLTKGPGRDRPGEPGWTDNHKVELTGADGGPVMVGAVQQYDLSQLPLEDLDQLDHTLQRALTRRSAPAGEGGEGAP